MEDEATVFSRGAAADLVCRDAPCVRDPAFEGKAYGQSFQPWTVLGCHLKVVGRQPSHWGPHHVTGKLKRRGHRQPVSSACQPMRAELKTAPHGGVRDPFAVCSDLPL